MTPSGDKADRLTDVFVQRDAGGTSELREAACLAATDRNICFALHRVHWETTTLSPCGRRLIYRFRAPDAESVRVALRKAHIAFEKVWTSGS